jgi:hypothetical protein
VVVNALPGLESDQKRGGDVKGTVEWKSIGLSRIFVSGKFGQGSGKTLREGLMWKSKTQELARNPQSECEQEQRSCKWNQQSG